MDSKRQIPSTLKALMQWDVEMTNTFVKRIDKTFGPLAKYRQLFKTLEISCHGLPWICGSLLLSFVINMRWIRNICLNILIALLLDIVCVSVTKAFVRRRRPVKNTDDMFITISVDKFSFPSGHATRAVMVLYLLSTKSTLFYYLSPLLLVWSCLICLTRVLLRRHHLLDVAAGIAIGWIEGAVIGRMFWFSTETTEFLFSSLLS